MKKILLGDELLIILALIGDTTFGVDILDAVSIIEPKKLRTVPLAPKYISYILNYQGRVITLFDMKTYFGCEENQNPEEDKKIIYLKLKELHIGLLVDKIIKIDYISQSCKEPVPDEQEGSMKTGFSQGVFIPDEDAPGIYWLDVKKIGKFAGQINMNTPHTPFAKGG